MAAPSPNTPDAGLHICQALRGAWRPIPPGLSDGVLEAAGPALLESGAGGLCWRLLQGTPLAASSLGRLCHKVYRLNLMEAAAWEQHAQKVVRFLRQHDIEPLLIKGLATARAYALAPLRPHGDIDLCIQPAQFPQANEILFRNPVLGQHVDLHCGVPDLRGGPPQDAWQRSIVIPLDHTTVRVLAPEDHLRLLCLHAVRHRLERPLWLCDIAATLEALPANFDWDYCLRGRRYLADWVLCLTGLARRLLDARISDPTIAVRAQRLPDWLIGYVLESWSRWALALPGTQSTKPLIRNPRAFNPVRAAYRVGLSPYHGLLALRLASALSRPWQVLVRLHRGLAGLARKRFTAHAIHSQRIY